VTTADVRDRLVERLAEKLDLELERLPAAEDASAVV
jgi:hypothetical protein